MYLLSLHVDFSQIPDLKTYSTPIILKYKIKILHHCRGQCSCGVVDDEQKTDKRCGVASPCMTAGGFGVPFDPVQTGHTVKQQQP